MQTKQLDLTGCHPSLRPIKAVKQTTSTKAGMKFQKKVAGYFKLEHNET
jgi:hypothetical protein